MNVTPDTLDKWQRQVEADPYGSFRASALKVLLEDIAELRTALSGMVAMFGNPHKEEYVDGGPSYERALKTVADAKAALGGCG